MIDNIANFFTSSFSGYTTNSIEPEFPF
jgi:hypothetical protein